MAKSISVDNETYELIAAFAKEEDRPISNALSRLVEIGLEISRPVNTRTAEEQKILEQLDRIEKILSGRGSIASTTIAEMDGPVTPPALSEPEPEPEPEEYVELSYDEMIQRITDVKNELNAPDISKEHKEELENELRGLLADLSIAE